jgi:hypothetical protein
LGQEDSLRQLYVLLGGLNSVGVGVHEVFEGLQSLFTDPLLAGEALDTLHEGHPLLAREHIGALDPVWVSSKPWVNHSVSEVGDVEVLKEPLGDGFQALECLKGLVGATSLTRFNSLLLGGEHRVSL